MEPYWLWFAELYKLNITVRESLLADFPDIESIYRCADYSHLSYISLKDKTILMNKNIETCEKIIEDSARLGIKIITFDSPLYPPQLKQIYNPPYVLYAKGNIPDWDNSLFIGVVGTRRCTDYGVSATEKFCRGFAENGITTISGLARGIDSVVASTALEFGGSTIGVLGCGLDVTYPPENKKLIDAVAENGLVLSEYPPGTPPHNFHFPQRNRIISGISHGVLVAESASDGGSLITARLALEQGKDLFCIPGSIFKKYCEGTNLLISEGNARAVMSVNDIINEYSRSFSFTKKEEDTGVVSHLESVSVASFSGLSETEEAVARLLLSGEMHSDELLRKSGLSASELNTTLSMLEFYGNIIRLSGNIYKLKI